MQPFVIAGWQLALAAVILGPNSLSIYMTPKACMAAATRSNPAMLAPST